MPHNLSHSPTAKQHSAAPTADATFTAWCRVSEFKPFSPGPVMLPQTLVAHGPNLQYPTQKKLQSPTKTNDIIGKEKRN